MLSLLAADISFCNLQVIDVQASCVSVINSIVSSSFDVCLGGWFVILYYKPVGYFFLLYCHSVMENVCCLGNFDRLQ